ncbi:hypothetical protein ACET3X_002375 [Alternaria dauci]|uniref:Uncharacterized protein n=1 Tax=Alternaria dauci TaxID=48095 RepID=A0ABR3UPG8_9PLEO
MKPKPNMQDIINGAYQVGHRDPSDKGPWTHHWKDEKGNKFTAQYWLPGQPAPTGKFPRAPETPPDPMAEYHKARAHGRQSTFHGACGLREGYGMGVPQGFENGYGMVEMGGQAWETGFGHGLLFGGIQGYHDGHEDYFDDWDQYDRYDAEFGGEYGAFDGYGGYDEGYDGYYGGGYDGEYDQGYGGYYGGGHGYW